MTGRPRVPLADRFWPRVVCDLATKCWMWTGPPHDGYGRLGAGGDGKHIRAHVASWVIHFGPVPIGLYVLHQCDRRACVRPGHLFLGTSAANTADKVAKGRQSRGDTHGRTKITVAKVAELRSRYANGSVTQRDLATMYGISATRVGQLVHS